VIILTEQQLHSIRKGDHKNTFLERALAFPKGAAINAVMKQNQIERR